MSGQTDLLYAAEEDSQGNCWFDDALAPGDVSGFVACVLDTDGWVGTAKPVILYEDLPDDHAFAAWCHGDSIHVDQRLLSRWIVLHELAHWARPNVDGHGPQFCAVLVRFMSLGLGRDVGDYLLDTFREFGVEVDPEWLNESLAPDEAVSS